MHPPTSVPITTLILPGLFNSGPDHWQSHWERRDPACVRVEQREWDAPRREDWVETLDAAIANASGPVVLVGHSSACPLVAHWTRTATHAQCARVRGALLVAPSDPDGPAYPKGPTGFGPVPLDRLPFPSVVVASEDDVYVTIERAREYASAWGSAFVNVGRKGHINSASGLGEWAEGYALLAQLRGGAR
jgi:serine hydrolase